MKLLEFLGIIRENDSNGTGKFVGARLTRDSERAIMRWMRDNGLRKKEPRARMHITVIGDKEKSFPWNPATFEPPLEIDPGSYKIEKFDHGSIVLAFSVPELEKRHEAGIKQHGIQWDHPTYQPHITLSYDPTELNNVERLLLPTFPLYVSHEYEQPWEFDEADLSSCRRRNSRIDEAILFERNVMNAPETTYWAKNMADEMFGTNPNAPHVGTPHGTEGTTKAAHDWAQKALRKYMINDVPAPQILAFKPTPNDPRNAAGASPDMSGTAKVHYPRTGGAAMFGILTGHTKDRNMTVPNWVPAALERGEEVFYVDDRFIGQMRGAQYAVRDWFRHLANTDPGRLNPGRLNRMTWEQAEQAAFAWHDEMKAAEASNVEEDERDRVMYIDYGDGTAWWKLIGETCLTREGDLMGHCVADYVDDVASGESTILSLRDKENKPHVTVELNDVAYIRDASEAGYRINQVKGKENKAPVEKYWKYVDGLIKKLDSEGQLEVSPEGHGDLRECDIQKLGPMLLRTEPSLDEVECVLSIVQYPPDAEWSMFDHEKMHLWEAVKELIDRDILPENEEHFDFSYTDENAAVQYIRWKVLSDGEFDVQSRERMDPQFFHDNPDYAGLGDELERDIETVPTDINIKAPDIKYEILAGNPDDFKYDIRHALVSKESYT